MGKRKRSYDQSCTIARALDVVGDRWTILLIRELLIGPRRFKDLAAGLPGIGTNLLSDRLKEMEVQGIIERVVLPAPSSVAAYALTPSGRALEPVLMELFRWAWQHLDRSDPRTHSRPAWTVVALRALFAPDAAAGLDEAYEFRVDDEVFHARVQGGGLTTALGPASSPCLVVTADAASFDALASGRVDEEARASGRLSIEGGPEALARAARVFGGPVV